MTVEDDKQREDDVVKNESKSTSHFNQKLVCVLCLRKVDYHPTDVGGCMYLSSEPLTSEGRDVHILRGTHAFTTGH